MKKYWVVGGEYASTAFDKMAPGKTEERHGPYTSLKDARAQWQRLSWQKVDNCNVRYRIEEENAAPVRPRSGRTAAG